MRQVVLPRHGPPEVFDLRESPDPLPGDRDVRIRIRAAGINFADVLARQGLYPDAPQPPCVIGYEAAGVIDAVGGAVAGFHEGDRVVALTRAGAYADTATVPAAQVFHIPDGVSDSEAAAVPVNYLTAAVALYRMAALSAGETVLIQNAGGGVGVAATQLARLRRGMVIGTASASKHGALQSFGVEHTIDYRNSDVVQAVQEITRQRGVDVILDSTGHGYAASYRMLAPLGRLVLFGLSPASAKTRAGLLNGVRSWWTAPRFDPMSAAHLNRGVFGLSLGHLWGERRQLAPLMEMLLGEVRAARIAPVVARTFPLAQVAEAHRFIQARQNIGKVVLTM